MTAVRLLSITAENNNLPHVCLLLNCARWWGGFVLNVPLQFWIHMLSLTDSSLTCTYIEQVNVFIITSADWNCKVPFVICVFKIQHVNQSNRFVRTNSISIIVQQTIFTSSHQKGWQNWIIIFRSWCSVKVCVRMVPMLGHCTPRSKAELLFHHLSCSGSRCLRSHGSLLCPRAFMSAFDPSFTCH